jgi:PAS domain S-box-containing protein
MPAPLSESLAHATSEAASGNPDSGGDVRAMPAPAPEGNAADQAIYLLDIDGNVARWNDDAGRLDGYSLREVVGAPFRQFFSAEDREQGTPDRALDAAVRDGHASLEAWRVRKDGSTYRAGVAVSTVRAPDDRLSGFTVIVRDLTEQHRAQERIRRTEEQFRRLVQGVTDYAIFMLDRSGRISSWNAGAQRIKGYLPQEIIGEHFSRFYTPEDLAEGEPARALETAIRTGAYEKEGWRVRKDGSRFFASVVIEPVRDDAGEIVGFAKITRDVSERRQAQAALDVARDALMQSQKMEAIGQLTGGIAHDFNNLLMAVQGSLELLRRRLADDPRALALVDNAIHGAQRGAALTQRMLAFARRQDLHLDAVDVSQLVRGMTLLLERTLGPSVAIDMRFPAKLERVRADANQFELALLNLALNARDAMPQGGPLIFRAHQATLLEGNELRLPPGRYVCVATIDAGTGMDEQTLQRAAEPFFTTKGVGKGTGLGLSMVHGVVEQSGGKLILKSEVGAGTTAEMWLPVADGDAVGADREITQPVAPGHSRWRLVVIAVDDDDLVLRNTVMMLEELGHRVLGARSGDEALEILGREARVDLVITDQAMPGMTGVELAEAVRERWPQVRLLIATGFAELPHGSGRAFAKLDKPFRLADLARAIGDLTAG